MANPVGNTVSRLVRRYAYARGERARLEREEEKLRDQMASMRRALLVIESKKRDLDAGLDQLRVEIERLSSLDVGDVRSIRATPRRVDARYGTFSAELIRFLKAAGRSVPSSEVFEHMRTQLDLPYETGKERRWTHDRIRRQLREFVKKGAVDRSPELVDGERMWLWVGIEDDDQDGAGDGPA